MTEIRALWSASLPAYPKEQAGQIRAAAGERYSAVCVSFWLFRFLHELPLPEAVLTGDACFALFSKHLASLDDVPLTDRFA